MILVLYMNNMDNWSDTYVVSTVGDNEWDECNDNLYSSRREIQYRISFF